MSVDIYIQMHRDPEGLEFKNKLKALRACQRAQVAVPQELLRYFKMEYDDDDPALIASWEFSDTLADMPTGVRRVERGYEINLRELYSEILFIKVLCGA